MVSCFSAMIHIHLHHCDRSHAAEMALRLSHHVLLRLTPDMVDWPLCRQSDEMQPAQTRRRGIANVNIQCSIAMTVNGARWPRRGLVCCSFGRALHY